MELGCDRVERHLLRTNSVTLQTERIKMLPKKPSATDHKTVSQSEARGKILAHYPQAN